MGNPMAALGVSILGFAALNLLLGISMYGELGTRNRAALRTWIEERKLAEEKRKQAE